MQGLVATEQKSHNDRGFGRYLQKNDYDRGGSRNDRWAGPGQVLLALAHMVVTNTFSFVELHFCRPSGFGPEVEGFRTVAEHCAEHCAERCAERCAEHCAEHCS